MAYWIKKYVTFIIGGGLGSLINLSITYLLVEFGGLWYLTAYLGGGIGNILFNFMYQRAITFGVKDEAKKRLAKFFVTNIAVGICLMGLIYVLTDWLKIWYIASGVIATAIMSLINFRLNVFWVFKENK